MVYLVGAGPGDAGLITVKGLECLRRADTVIYDRLVNPQLLRCVSVSAERIYAGKSPARQTLSQDEINKVLVKKAKAGKIVVRLKCGDPFLFGRGAEEAMVLASHKIPFEVIPGITSAIAVPAYAGIPLTHREYTSSVGIFTGHEDVTKNTSCLDWEKIATGLGTIVFLMGVRNISEIASRLIASGRAKNSPCCIIQQGTLPQQRSVYANLAEIAEKARKAKIRPPAILVIGKVVSLRAKLNWFEAKPLLGKKILITRPGENQEHKLSRLLEDCGALCVEFPVAEIKPLADYTTLDNAIRQIDGFQWIIFTSQKGLRFFKERLACQKKDLRILKGIKLAAIGPKTAAVLKDLGIRLDVEAATFCQEGLLERFQEINLKGKNILLVRALKARDILPKGLEKRGASVTIAPAYQTVKTKIQGNKLKYLRDSDIITFTSASCVQGFVSFFSRKTIFSPNNKFKIASIGPATSAAARKSGLKVAIEAKQYTFDGLTEAIVRYYKKS